MEEFIGKLWHRYISQSAVQSYPDRMVELDEIRKPAGIIFRAFGGEGGIEIKTAWQTDNRARRSLVQRIAGSGKKNVFASVDGETLRLPASIALFDDKQLNRDLYLWLAAICSQTVEQKFWLASNQQRTRATLEHWPGLSDRYHRLVEAHIKQRPLPADLPHAEASQEHTIQSALRSPEKAVNFRCAAKRVPQAVPLWLHPSPPHMTSADSQGAQRDPDHEESKSKKVGQEPVKGKQGSRTDTPDEKDGLLSFRLESLWSWSEYIKVDRTGVDDDDDDTARTAEDMDKISVTQDSKSAGSKIKIDLDLPSSEYDDIVLGEGIPVDEWDYKSQSLLKGHCRVQPMEVRSGGEFELPDSLKAQARKVRQQFEMLRPERQWVRRQTDGTELDLGGFVDYLSDRKMGHTNSDMPVFREIRRQHRNLSCLLLADLSLSTEAYVDNEKQVIDVVRDSLFLFSEALDATGDRFALHGFSSRNRGHVRFYNIKTFDSSYDGASKARINAITPGYYTRMGAAIRHATSLLEKERSSQKLLLLLTDGKPNDLDKYEGRYGVEDTKRAVLEAESKGVHPFCVTIDQQAEEYLPYLFGRQSYVVIHNSKTLPQKLLLLYMRLTR